MTLVVYKNNILAADKRTTSRCGHHKDGRCASCGDKASSVNDNAIKVRLGSRLSKFRDQKVLAFAASGDTELLRRMCSIVREGSDLEQAYATYLKVAGSHTVRDSSCALMLICESKSYVVVIPGKGEPRVDEYDRDHPLYIGSGSAAGLWIDKLTDAAAVDIINLVMVDTGIGVGGDIDFIDLKDPATLVITNVKQRDPATLLTSVQNAFKVGQHEMEHQRRTELAKKNIIRAKPETKPVTRKPRVPKAKPK